MHRKGRQGTCAAAGEAATMGLQKDCAREPRRRARANRWFHRLAIIAAIAMGGALLAGDMIARSAEIAGAIVSDGQYFRRLVLIVNKSHTLRADRPFTRVVVAGPDIADALPMSDRTLYIQAKKIGTTNISLFDENARIVGIIDLEVNIDVVTLQQKIQASTGSRGIHVSSISGQVILSGLATDAIAADRAVQVAKALSPEGVVNAMQVAPSQQVMLEVRFLEVTRDAGRHVGVNWAGATPGPNGVKRGFTTGRNETQLVNSNTVPSSGTPPLNGSVGIPLIQSLSTLVGTATPAAGFGTILANVISTANGTTLDVLITALETKGLVRRLAEPNLITLSGDPARFLAGGEFPVPVAATTLGGIPTITIEFKKFGVELAFVPTVLARGVINLRVEPSVSELDFANAVTISGTTIPALTKRDARTTVELRDGQSFAIAGLLQTRSAKDIQQVPWLGSVPVLGSLFRSSAYIQNETDLVIIVTPRLVSPAVPGQQLASPLNSRLPGNDVDFFLNGQPEVRKRYTDYVAAGGELKGPYGHIVVPEYNGNGAVLSTRN
jgi:pilus assembly protein CpaC